MMSRKLSLWRVSILCLLLNQNLLECANVYNVCFVRGACRYGLAEWMLDLIPSILDFVYFRLLCLVRRLQYRWIKKRERKTLS